MAAGDSFYIATPIFYVNDVPHIGHAYTEVAADVLARWHRQSGDDTWLLTGTDEHGQKILRTAVANDTTPQAWADKLVSESWYPLLETLQIENDDFIRTTDERHETAVTIFLQKLYDDGYIYSGEYEGYYCVGCEEYKQQDDLLETADGDYAGQLVCKIHGRPVEVLKERNYFFRMSDFQQRLLDLYESRPDFVQPESVRNEIIQFVRSGLQDLSVSRSSFDWGIKVPWDDSHVVYVWFEALLNYITAIGWGVDDDNFRRRWPATQLVGKDIARFHAVIWPAMLMAAGLEPPKQVFGHGWLLVGGEKMSKSKLTGIAPNQITDTFGVDAFRYYFMSAIGFGQDGSFSWEDLSARYQAELANGFGNLASRVIAMLGRYFDGVVPAPGEYLDAELGIQRTVRQAAETADAAISRLAIHEAIAAIWTVVDELNGYITLQEPWALAKDDAQRDRLATVLYSTAEGLRALAVLLSPVIPGATQKLWSALGAGSELGQLTDQVIVDAGHWGQLPPGSRVHAIDALFPRIEAEPVTDASKADPSTYIRQRDTSSEAGQSRDLSYPPLPPALTVGCYDNHTHLEIADGDGLDYLEQLDRASSVGIRGVVQVGGDLETSRWSAEMAAKEPRMLAAVAIHPNEAPRYEHAGTLDEAIAEIDELAARPRVRAVGETGLDYFRTDEAGRPAQLRSFEAHIDIAKRHDLAMQIHDRDAHDDVIATLRRVGAPERTVFHCFSGDAAMAKLCADEGWYLSFAGNVTFKNAGALREALEVIPRDRILVETDAPFLTPVPLRGRPNSPYLIPITLRFMADHLQTEVSMLAAQISSNTELVYGTWDAEPVTQGGSPWDDAIDPSELA